jgi:hypothetical protein
MASARELGRARANVPHKVEDPQIGGIRQGLCVRRTSTGSGRTSFEMLRFGDDVLDVDRALLRDPNGTEIAQPRS